MRHTKFLMILAATVSGIFAVQSVQAQTIYSQPYAAAPTYYAKPGWAPMPMGSTVHFTNYGQRYSVLAGDSSFYLNNLTGLPQAVPFAAWTPQTVSTAGPTFIAPSGFVSPYIVGQPRVIVVRDVSNLPGYGLITPKPQVGGAKPFNAEDFPPVFTSSGMGQGLSE